MLKIIVTFELLNNVEDIPRDEIEDWLDFELGYSSTMMLGNRLHDEDIKAKNIKYEVE